MNINLLNYSENISELMPIWAVIVVSIIAFLFIFLGIFILIYYFKVNPYKDEFKIEGENYKSGSYKGFWHRNRSAILMFLVATFLIIGIILLSEGLLGIVPNSNL